MMQLLKNYKWPLAFALALHVALILFICLHRNSTTSTVAAVAQPNIIQAVAVNSSPIAEPVTSPAVVEPEAEPPAIPEPDVTEPPPPAAPTEEQLDHKAEIAAAEEQAAKQQTLERLAEEKIRSDAKALAAKQQAEQQQESKRLAAQRAEAAKALKEAKQQTLQAKAAELKHLEEIKQLEAKKKLAELAKQQQKAAERLLAQQLATEEKSLQQASHALQMQGEVDKYKGMIIQAIAQHWLVPDMQQKDILCKLLVRLAPGGVVLTVKLIQSSGDPALDRSAIAAVHKASPLPVPEDINLFDKFRELSLTVHPDQQTVA